MNSGSKKTSAHDETRRSRPKNYYGGLPASMDDAQQVTTESNSGPFRSVGISSAQIPDIGGPNFGMEPPSLSRDRGYGSSKTKMHHPKDSLSSSDCFSDDFSPFGSSLNVSPKSFSSSPVWNMDDNSLAPKPDFYTLEPTTTFVPNCRASIVASRISNFLLERNISATYNEVKAKAKCITADKVEFRVRLYRGKKQFHHGVIVEVQRRYGFSVHYHRDAMGILDVAAGKSAMPSLEEPFSHEHKSEKSVRAQLIY